MEKNWLQEGESGKSRWCNRTEEDPKDENDL
jgi:hypothetical protein